jgi:hypothetical protein
MAQERRQLCAGRRAVQEFSASPSKRGAIGQRRPRAAAGGDRVKPSEHDPEKHARAKAGVDTGFRKRLVPAKAGIMLQQ